MSFRFTAGWIVCVLALLPADVLTCSCIWAGPFLTVGPREELIVRAKVSSYSANAMDVDVHETLKGDPKAAKVRIWGDTGVLCRPYVTSFPLGTEWVFAVRANPDRTEGGYVISACGEFAVRVEKESVSGQLTAGKPVPESLEMMNLKELRNRLQAAAQ